MHKLFNIFNKHAIQFKKFIITEDLNCDLLSSFHVSNHLKTYISLKTYYMCGATHHVNNNETWLNEILLDNKYKKGSYFKSMQPFISGHDYLVCEYLIDMPKRCALQN